MPVPEIKNEIIDAHHMFIKKTKDKSFKGGALTDHSLFGLD